jgi:hypothetical protein
MKIVNIDWLAGSYEGEGWPPRSTCFCLSISQRNRDVLELIQTSFGGKILGDVNGNHSWSLYGRKSVPLALDLLDHMNHPEKIEQLKKSLIVFGYLPPRNEQEKKEAFEFRQGVKARQERARQKRIDSGKLEEYVRTNRVKIRSRQRELWHEKMENIRLARKLREEGKLPTP